jgi:hypothetical protein
MNFYAMEKSIRSLSHISLIFFFIFGVLHIGASMLLTQGIDGNYTQLSFQVMDLPFLLAGLIYGTTRLTMHIGAITGKLKVPFIICSAMALVLFLIALYFNFILPDVQL